VSFSALVNAESRSTKAGANAGGARTSRSGPEHAPRTMMMLRINCLTIAAYKKKPND
jgi:hypothetical protein